MSLPDRNTPYAFAGYLVWREIATRRVPERIDRIVRLKETEMMERKIF